MLEEALHVFYSILFFTFALFETLTFDTDEGC